MSQNIVFEMLTFLMVTIDNCRRKAVDNFSDSLLELSMSIRVNVLEKLAARKCYVKEMF